MRFVARIGGREEERGENNEPMVGEFCKKGKESLNT